jgi:hypothetical protein
MKCLYYLASTLDSTRKVTDDLHAAGINDWFIHVLSKDLAGLKKYKIHSSNYLEQLDILRFGILGGLLGFFVGLLAVWLFSVIKPFGSDMPSIVYFALAGFLTLFGTWEGGLAGIASENKKTSLFHDELEAGKYLILIYARKEAEDTVRKVMGKGRPEAKLAAVDANFYNPLIGLKRL